MKKIIGIFITLIIISLSVFLVNSYAVALDTLQVQIDKTIVRPGENVQVTINFGQTLGAGDFDISYDSNIFDYVSNQGGTANNTGDKVAVSYYEATNPVDNISVTFRAKSGITTSNPTEFTVTASSLVNSDATVFFDDITTPIVKNVTVEPEYIDYTLKLESTGTLVKEQENEMKLSYSSTLGRYYANARLIAEVVAPGNAITKLLATDTASLEHDIIQSGWGDAQGYPIGGPNYAQVLNVRGVFSDVGNYTITLKLIDRGNSDAIIAQRSFDFTVADIVQNTPTENQTTETPTETQQASTEQTTLQAAAPAQASTPVPAQPQTTTAYVYTGRDNYAPIILIVFLAIGTYICYRKKTFKKNI